MNIPGKLALQLLLYYYFPERLNWDGKNE